MNSASAIQILQTSISPVVLISGVGLLLLTLTNRLGRATDRARQMAQYHRTAPELDKPGAADQIRILYRRAEVLRTSILCGGLCVFFVSLTVIGLLVMVLFRPEIGWIIISLFVASLASLIASIMYFLGDIVLSLRALRMEVEEHLHPGK